MSNVFFKILLGETWVEDPAKNLYKADGKDLFMLKTDVMLKEEKEMNAIAKEYAEDNDKFLKDFVAAWTKLSNNDRFDGPTGNLCD